MKGLPSTKGKTPAQWARAFKRSCEPKFEVTGAERVSLVVCALAGHYRLASQAQKAEIREIFANRKSQKWVIEILDAYDTAAQTEPKEPECS